MAMNKKSKASKRKARARRKIGTHRVAIAQQLGADFATPEPGRGAYSEELTDIEIVVGLNEWMRRYTEEPERFAVEHATVKQFLNEQDDRNAGASEESYGIEGFAYLCKVIMETRSLARLVSNSTVKTDMLSSEARRAVNHAALLGEAESDSADARLMRHELRVRISKACNYGLGVVDGEILPVPKAAPALVKRTAKKIARRVRAARSRR